MTTAVATKQTKLEHCRDLLKAGHSISPAEAVTHGLGFRLSDLIYRLRRKENLPVVTEMRENVSTREKYASYHLVRVGDRIRATCCSHYGELATVTGIEAAGGLRARIDGQAVSLLFSRPMYEVLDA